MLLVAILTVEVARLDAFRAYETKAVHVMARYGGHIERVLVMTSPEGVIAESPPTTPPPPRRGILGIIDEVGRDLDREVEKVLHPNEAPGLLRELHVVSFPDAEAYEAYRRDSEIVALAAERERCVRSTQIWRADEGPPY